MVKGDDSMTDFTWLSNSVDSIGAGAFGGECPVPNGWDGGLRGEGSVGGAVKIVNVYEQLVQ